MLHCINISTVIKIVRNHPQAVLDGVVVPETRGLWQHMKKLWAGSLCSLECWQAGHADLDSNATITVGCFPKLIFEPLLYAILLNFNALTCRTHMACIWMIKLLGGNTNLIKVSGKKNPQKLPDYNLIFFSPVIDGSINWSSILHQLVVVSEAAAFPSNSRYLCANSMQVGMLPE